MRFAQCCFRSLMLVAAAAVAALLASSAGAAQPPSLSVATLSPSDGQVVSDKVKWEVAVSGGQPERVEFAIDGSVKWTDSSAPYIFNGDDGYLNALTLSAGKHTLKASAFVGSGRGQKASSAISIVVAHATTTTTSSSIYWGATIDGLDTYGSSYGNAPWDSNTWNLFESHSGKKTAVLSWSNGKPWNHDFNYFLSGYQKVLGRGDLSLISLNSGTVPLRAIAAGKYDSPLTTWVRQAKAWGHPFFLRWDAEMNGNWEPYSPGVNGNTPSDFVDMWRHFHDLAVQAGATNITWVWCPNADRGSAFVPYSQLYPGDGYVDWTCLDGYNKGGTGWTSFSTIFGASYNSLLQIAPKKPIMIAETGSVENGRSKASWITDAFSTQVPKSFPQVRAVLWTNWRIYQNNYWWNWEIESSASAQTAFANAITSAYYRPGGSFGSLPLLSKIKPL